MTIYPIQPSFARGVLCPELQARVDIEQYRSGLADCLNFIPIRQGGLRRRPGTYYAGMAKEQAEASSGALLPFRFSESQAYAIELSELYARFYALGGRVETSPGVAYELATPWTRAQARELGYAQSGDVVFATHGSVKPKKISRLAETSWTVTDDEIEDGPYLDVAADATTLTPSARGKLSVTATADSTNGSNVASNAVDDSFSTYWEAATSTRPNWLRADCTTSKIAAGYSLAADPDRDGLASPRSWTLEGSDDGSTWTVLDTRSGETGWANGERRYYEFSNENAFRYYRVYVTDVNDSPDNPNELRIADFALQGAGADATTITITATSTAGINGGDGFKATDVGRHLRYFSEDAYWHWFVIASRSSATVITATLRSIPLPSTKRSGTWRLGAFSETTGYPAFVAFYQDRKCFARTTEQPGTIWLSRTGAYNDFSTSIPAQEDDAVTVTLPEGEIRWLAELEALVIGTDSALRSLGPADRTKGFSATNFSFGKPYWAGMQKTRPVRAGDTLLAMGDFGKSLREVQSADGLPGFVAPEVSVLSEHLLAPGVVGMTFAQSPGALAWLWLEDGTMVSATYEREQQMFAMAPHLLGGDGFVEWATAIPGDGRHELWLMVWRDGIGRTIERMAQDFKNLDAADAFHVDCGLTYSGAAAVTVSGWDHLEGETVAIWADGAFETPVAVSSGDIVLGSGQAAEKVSAGLEFRSWGRTMRITEGSPDGTALGRKKIVRGVSIDVLDTALGRVRSAGSANWEDLKLRSFADPISEASPLAAGPLRAATDSSWERSQGQVEFESVGAAPLTIRAIVPAVEAEP